jgi:hypothetical protein
MRRVHKIANGEMEMLSRLALLGDARSTHDYQTGHWNPYLRKWETERRPRRQSLSQILILVKIFPVTSARFSVATEILCNFARSQ